jgi:GNAT superfamily N-acetyltransferase
VDEIETRLATGDDVDAIIAVFRAGVETYREFAPVDWQPPDPDRDNTRDILADPRTWAMLALAGAEVVGHCSFTPARERGSDASPRGWRDRPLIPGMSHLWQLFVRPRWWGTGVGALLHDAGVAEMRAQGYECARLYTPTAHTRARRFYERRDWSAVDEQEDTDFGLPLTEYRLELAQTGSLASDSQR